MSAHLPKVTIKTVGILNFKCFYRKIEVTNFEEDAACMRQLENMVSNDNFVISIPLAKERMNDDLTEPFSWKKSLQQRVPSPLPRHISVRQRYGTEHKDFAV